MIKKIFVSAYFVAALQVAHAQKSKAWSEGSPANYTPSPALMALNAAFKDLGHAVAPTVVNIYTASKVAPQGMNGLTGPQADLFRYFFGNPMGPGPQGPQFDGPAEKEQSGAGSGFVINKDGLIVTNSHVVRMNDRVADQIRVKFIGEGESSQGAAAKVIGIDPLTDVAVIRVEGLAKDKLNDLKVAPLGNSEDLSVGEIVFAVGNPYGHTHSVTQGIVSALGREVDINTSNFIQTDASINPGNSGGPLFNIKGEVVGINTAIDARAQGIGFAIPINSAKRVIEQLIEKGSVTWGYVGISMQPLTDQIAKSLGLKSTRGALVVGVEKGGPANAAGLRSYDVVTKLNDKAITSVRDLSVAVRAMDPGTLVKVEYTREGKVHNTSLKVGQLEGTKMAAQEEPPEPKIPDGNYNAVLGVAFADLTPALRARTRIPVNVNGVLVTKVQPGSLGDEMKLMVGNVISEINQRKINSQKDIGPALSADKSRMMIKVLNGSSERVLSVEFGD